MEIVTNGSDSVPTTSATNWSLEIQRAIRDPVELCRHLDLPESYEAAAVAASRSFRVFAPLPFVDKMRRGDPRDPLLRQVLPLSDELLEPPVGYSRDPLDEASATLTPGLLQKYRGRALMVVTGACAVHCRYCFRRHFPYGEGPAREAKWAGAIGQIASDATLQEVLLSGGDPLTLPDDDLAALVKRLAEIPHLRRLRIHTRLPIVIPQRVDNRLLDWLTAGPLAPIVVVHANHPSELQADVLLGLRRLVQAGVTVLNQTVLLRGVNDSAETQERLCRLLVDHQVLPYYLHQMDRVAGAAHFETGVDVGLKIIAELRDRLPGYAVPRFVREEPGRPHKTVLA